MPRVAPGQRKRAYKPKTRTGCTTLRRVKCDEKRPHCLKCSSTGRTCDGYIIPIVAAPHDELSSSSSSYTSPELEDLLFSTSSSSPSSSTTTLTRVPSPTTFLKTDFERHAFHFFIHMTAPMMSGFAAEPCWSELIPRAAHHEPSIRHAVLAIGALHWVRERGLRASVGADEDTFSKEEEQFALKEYGKSIRSLVGPITGKNGRGQSMDVCLISCFLFSCFEIMQGNYGSGVAHQQSGSKILCEIAYDEKSKSHSHSMLRTSSTPYIPMPVLEQIYLRTDFVLTQMINSRDLSIYQKYESTYLSPSPPSVFTSLPQARNALHFLWTRFRNELNVLERAPSNELHTLFTQWQNNTIQATDQWMATFSNYLAIYEPTLTPGERVGVSILQLQIKTGYLNAHVPTFHDDEMAWDAYLDIFISMLDLAEEIVRNAVFEKTTFSIDMGVIGPLYHVSAVCRDPVVRRRAISMLEEVPQLQEGVWNAGMTARVARRVVEIEEGGREVRSAGDVPDWARINSVTPMFDKESKLVSMRYSRDKIGMEGGGGRDRGVKGQCVAVETFGW